MNIHHSNNLITSHSFVLVPLTLPLTSSNLPGIHPQYGIRWLEEKCTWPLTLCFARGEMDMVTVTDEGHYSPFEFDVCWTVHRCDNWIIRCTPVPRVHATLNVTPIRDFIYHLTANFFDGCPAHPNPLGRSTGNYSLTDLHHQYKKYIHKGLKHFLF